MKIKLIRMVIPLEMPVITVPLLTMKIRLIETVTVSVMSVTPVLDVCPGTPFEGDVSVPEIKLKPNHFVLGIDGYNFDKGEVKGKGEGTDKSFTIVDTHGCSCEQIIEKLGLGNGHRKFGCSPGVMDCWVNKNCDDYLFDRNLRG